VDCQAIQSNNSLNRGIGNYSEDFLTYLVGSELKFEITLMVNALLPRTKVDQIVKLCHPENSITIREWMPLSNSGWLGGEKSRREVSEDIYAQVLISTKPDDFILLSPFEGLSEDACWILPVGIHGTVIFYDAIPRIFSKRYLAADEVREWYDLKATSLRKFHRVLAISDSASLDASTYLEIDKERVQVIHFGVLDRFFEFTEDAVDENYVLAVLGEDERKNKANLLLAWKRIKDSAPELKLKIVYKQSPPEKVNNQRFLQANNLENIVEFLDYVDPAELDRLYKNCSFSIFPSFYEGLGLPVLESFAHFKPCIVSSTSALPELVKSAELIFDPNLPIDIEAKVLNLIKNEKLYSQAQKSGRETLAKYMPDSKKNQIRNLFSTESRAIEIQNDIQKNPKIHVNFYTILPPIPSGIANYAANLIHELHSNSELTLISNINPIDGYKCQDCGLLLDIRDTNLHAKEWSDNDIDIHNIGNSEHHIWQVDLIRNYPGSIIMHDGFLSGLAWSKSVSEGNIASFFEQGVFESSILGFIDRTYYDEPHKMIMHEKMNRFYLENSTSVIVHTQSAREMIENDFALFDPSKVKVIPHFARGDHPLYALSKRKKIVGVFGIIAETKMYYEIIEAWGISGIGKSGEFVLKFIGEDLSDNFNSSIKNVHKETKIECTGYLSEEEYAFQFSEISFAIQLRRDFRGETSGAVTELLARGIPVITNIEAWISDFKFAKELLIDSDFTISELAKKIDSVQVDLEKYLTNSAEIRSELQINASPAECVRHMLSFAQSSCHSMVVSPLSQLRSLKRKYPDALDDEFDIRDVAEACIRSFPSQFAKKRILILVKEDLEIRDPAMVEKLQTLFEEIGKHTDLPIVFGRNLSPKGYIEICNSLIVNPLFSDLNINLDYTTWVKPEDIFINLANCEDSLFSKIGVVDLVIRELGEYLA
jgi:glycosyltransferase involved in cell wall biosynthesis